MHDPETYFESVEYPSQFPFMPFETLRIQDVASDVLFQNPRNKLLLSQGMPPAVAQALNNPSYPTVPLYALRVLTYADGFAKTKQIPKIKKYSCTLISF